jgi:hypothetical protein
MTTPGENKNSPEPEKLSSHLTLSKRLSSIGILSQKMTPVQIIDINEHTKNNSPTDPVKSLINDCNVKSVKSQSRAQIFKIINILSSIFIIIGGIVVTISGLFEGGYYLQIIGGIMISGLKIFITAFSLEKKGLLYKILSLKFRQLSRKLKNLKYIKASEMDIQNTLNKAYQEFDELDLTFFAPEPMSNSNESDRR